MKEQMLAQKLSRTERAEMKASMRSQRRSDRRRGAT